MKSIIEFILHQGVVQPIALYWGVVADSDLYMTDLCESWAQHDLVTYVPVVSEPDTSPDWTGRTGLVGDVALGDFDCDGDLDIVTANDRSTKISILWNEMDSSKRDQMFGLQVIQVQMQITKITLTLSK